MQNNKMLTISILGLAAAIAAACGGATQKDNLEPTGQPAASTDTDKIDVPEAPPTDTSTEEPPQAPEETPQATRAHEKDALDTQQKSEQEQEQEQEQEPEQEKAEIKPASKKQSLASKSDKTRETTDKAPQKEGFKGKGPKRVILNKKGNMARVKLNHWGHQEAEIKCGRCHHYGVKSCSSQGCHTAGQDAAPGPKEAYHERCIPCHKKKKVASGCKDCHR